VIEVNIFSFGRMIYGRSVKVFVKKFLRPELKFKSLEELKDQMAEDKKASIGV
jgi:riboflavin kinase/FMN adenylyltransferase